MLTREKAEDISIDADRAYRLIEMVFSITSEQDGELFNNITNLVSAAMAITRSISERSEPPIVSVPTKPRGTTRKSASGNIIPFPC
jgi:hypothetical protein